MIRVFPRKTKWTPNDELAFVGLPKEPLLVPRDVPIRISVTFTWDRETAYQLLSEWRQYSSDIQIGGPAFDDPGIEFVPGQFIKEGITFTSRGCNKRCPWCLVWRREGRLRQISINPGYIVQDNNLLACSCRHIEKVFDMLREQKKPIKFSGGLDIDYLEPWHVDLLKSIKLDEVWVSCDREEDLKRLDKAADLLSDFSVEKKRCYVLGGFDGDTVEQAERRCEIIYRKGFLPFAQPYKPGDAEFYTTRSTEWCLWARKWSRPAIYRSKHDR